MRQHHNKYTSIIGIFILISVLVITNTSSDKDSTLWNRGTGIYPGNPNEDFSPVLIQDDEYRNIALHRAAFASSSYDYCLTANLITDGIIENEKPKYLVLETSEGRPERKDRHRLLDEHYYTVSTLFGQEPFILINLTNGWSETVDNIKINGLVSYLGDAADGSYEIVFSSSEDGEKWTEFHKIKGNKFIGQEARAQRHSDPDKASALGDQLLPTRRFILEEKLAQPVTFSQIRVDFRMKGAEQWFLRDIDFLLNGKNINLISSKFFNSTWMSLDDAQEWVYVDLGAKAKFDKVTLHWLERPASGRILVSDDAKEWEVLYRFAPEEGTTTKVTSDGAADATGTVARDREADATALLDAGQEGEKVKVEEFKVRGKGRYVKVEMDSSEDHGPYMLTEMEVWGKGGLVAKPKELPDGGTKWTGSGTRRADDGGKMMTLSGGKWKLIRASQVKETGVEISKTGYCDNHWITATVPGTVLTSFINIGAVPDPNFADNIMHISESYFNSDFWYRNTFDIDSVARDEKLWLELDGINWKADVYLNSHLLGKIEGAFIRGRFDISDLVQKGENALAVRIYKPANYGATKEKNRTDTGINGGILGRDNPTFHACIGWDWITTTRGRNIGIWNDVRICKEGLVSLDSPYIGVTLPLPDTTSAVLSPEILVKNNGKEAVRGVLRGSIGDIQFEQAVELKEGEERMVKFSPEDHPQLTMDNPKLWWPNGYGEQNLYPSGFSFDIDGKTSDEIDFNTGIRQVEHKLIDGVLHLYVNGRRFIGRGGNWGFSESNLNYRGREYDIAVEYHANCNFNIMRNWVGQIGDMELYEACDRHGIMVWQDFWLANPADGPNPDDNEMFMQNAEDFIKRIRIYPSMLIYCGRNEGYPPAELNERLENTVAQWHPDLHYIPSSADDCVSGHGPYNARSPKEYFSYEHGNDMFHSERGMPNVMSYESMKRTYTEDGLWPQGIEWYQHDYTLSGAQKCESFNNLIYDGYGKAENAEEFARLAQFVNYDGYRAMFESRSIKRKGLLLWMSHPCWPSMTWQTYDWYFETNGGYYGSKKGAEPLHIQWNAATDTIEVVNYNGRNQTGLIAEAMLVNLDGSIIWKKSTETDSYEDSTNRLFKMEYPDGVSDCHFIKLTLRRGNDVLSDNFYINGVEYGNHQALMNKEQADLDFESDLSLSDDGIWKGTVTVENCSDVPAIMVRVNIVGDDDGLQILPMFYEDNYFSLMPHESKKIDVKFYHADTRGEKPEVLVSGF